MNYSSIIHQFKNKKILVVGDIMLDEYILGTSTRISPEAPVPVINKSGNVLSLGGSANVANNLKQLGVKTFLIGSVGNDQNGKNIADLLRSEGFDLKNIIKDSRKPTTVKTRIISNGQQITRIDYEDTRDNLKKIVIKDKRETDLSNYALNSISLQIISLSLKLQDPDQKENKNVFKQLAQSTTLQTQKSMCRAAPLIIWPRLCGIESHGSGVEMDS